MEDMIFIVIYRCVYFCIFGYCLRLYYYDYYDKMEI